MSATERTKMMDFALSLGFSRQEIMAIYDVRVLKLLELAAQATALKSKDT